MYLSENLGGFVFLIMCSKDAHNQKSGSYNFRIGTKLFFQEFTLPFIKFVEGFDG